MTIYSYIQGGLGNQMFQYAIARALSEHYQMPFALNRQWFDVLQEGTTPREFQLGLLNIQSIDIADSPFPSKPNKVNKALQKILTNRPLVIYQQNAFEFDNSLFNLRGIAHRDLYLFGYWQAYPYIERVQKILQKEFKTKDPLLEFYQPYLQRIASSESVMVHIRRGDYVHSKSAAQFHGALPIDYYHQSMHELRRINPDAHFFVFSDDLQWAKESLQSDFDKTFVEHASSPDAAAHELQLMTACKHHIIANSSLSWWGAWLKQASGGLVYAPNHWVNDKQLNLSNLLPPAWKKVVC